jgi:hypothetical protein
MSARNFGLSESEIQELKKRPYPRFSPAPTQRLLSQAKVIWPFAVGWAVTLFLYSRIPISGMPSLVCFVSFYELPLPFPSLPPAASGSPLNNYLVDNIIERGKMSQQNRR